MPGNLSPPRHRPTAKPSVPPPPPGPEPGAPWVASRMDLTGRLARPRRRRRPAPHLARRRSPTPAGSPSTSPATGGPRRRSPTPTAHCSTARRFEHARPGRRRALWLLLDGLFYQGDVWLDGAYVGDTEGYFFPHAFEVTEALADRTEHVLGVEVACTRPRNRSPSATSPARSSTPTPSTRPGTPAASGGRSGSSAPGRSASATSACCAARPPRSGPWSRSGPCSTRPSRHARPPCTPASARSSEAESQPWPPVRTRSSGRSTVARARAVVAPRPGRPAAPRRRSRSPCHRPTDGSVSHRPHTPGSGCGRWPCDGWMLRVNGERLFLKGAT